MDMSMVPEVVAGREEGMVVIVLGLVTNAARILEKASKFKAEVKAEECILW
jgi:purine nucleoside phosphorylase